uniref:hypothetical protein n=1 Tax=Shewanella sp. TaxID=50422 RepID=UPI0040471FB3
MDPVTEAAILDGVYDAAYYTTYYGGKAMPYIKRAAGAYAGYKAIKSEGKRLGKSFSRARKMARSYNPFTRKGRAGIGSLERRSGFRKAKRPPPRGPAAPPYKRGLRVAVATSSRKQRKSRKPVKLSMMTKRHYDDHGTVTRAHSLWMGVEDSGSYDRMFDILGEAVTRAILSKAKIYPKLYDQPLGDFLAGPGGIGCVLTLGFKTINTAGTDALVNEVINNVEGFTFKTLSVEVTTRLKTRAESVGSFGQSFAYLDSFLLSISTDGDRLAYDLNMADAMLTIMAKSKVKFQNITTNTTGGDDLDVIGTNPINGKRYTFDDSRARLVSQVQERNASYDAFEGIKNPYGIVALNALPVDDPLAHPPAAKNVFVNCTGVAPVYIKAGGMSHHYQTFSIKRTMRQFIEDIAKVTNGFTRSKFGKVTWWCFERTYKQNGTGDTADDISIGFNRELTMSAMFKLKRDRSMLKHYDNQDVGAV